MFAALWCVNAGPVIAMNDEPSASVTTLTSFPNGTFLENLARDNDGSIIFTSYFDKSLQRLADNKLQAPLAKLDVHPVGIIKTAQGFIVTAHAIPFTNAPAFLSSNKILLLSGDGAVRRIIEAPEARFLNGLLAVSDDKVLIADSVLGMIWAFNPQAGTLIPWLKDDQLTADPSAKIFRPAANGLKVHQGDLYISNSSRGAIYKVRLSPDGKPAGALSSFVQPGPVDDFAFDNDGVIYAATHGERLLKITPDGKFNALLSTGCDSCTSVALIENNAAKSLIVFTTGNLFEGGKEEAKVLRVELGSVSD